MPKYRLAPRRLLPAPIEAPLARRDHKNWKFAVGDSIRAPPQTSNPYDAPVSRRRQGPPDRHPDSGCAAAIAPPRRRTRMRKTPREVEEHKRSTRGTQEEHWRASGYLLASITRPSGHCLSSPGPVQATPGAAFAVIVSYPPPAHPHRRHLGRGTTKGTPLPHSKPRSNRSSSFSPR